MRKVAAKIFLALCGVALGFGVLEAGLRLSTVSSPKWMEDPRTGLLILRPSAEVVSSNTCLFQRATSNAMGFNDRNHVKEKPEGAVRIAVLGDSFTEGLHVPAEARFSDLLEARLNSHPDRRATYEVLNFGITTHGTLENILYFSAYARVFHPDLAINAFLADNDVLDDAHSTREIPRAAEEGGVSVPPRPFRPHIRVFLRRSRAVVFLYNRLQGARQRAQSAVPGGGIPFDREVYLTTSSPYWDAAWGKEEEILGRLKETVEKNGVRFLLVSLAEGFRVHPELASELPSAYHEPGRFDFDGPERRLAEIAARKRFAYLPLLPLFRERAAKERDARIVWSCDGHWNKTGHEWAADAISEYLRAHPELISPQGSATL